MSDDEKRAGDRESFFLISTLQLAAGEQRVKIRNLSPSGALIEGFEFASVGDHGQLELRNIGDVGFSIAWAHEGRAGLKFDRTIDPNLVRGTSTRTLPQQEAPSPRTPDLPLSTSLHVGPFYLVRWMKGANAVFESKFDSLQDAKIHAKDRLAINRIRKGITAAEVSDIEGVAYFHFEA